MNPARRYASIITHMRPERGKMSTDDSPFSAESQANVASSTPSAPPELPWMKWQKGERVVLRYRLEDGLHDALGTVAEVAVDHVCIETRRGLVRVEASTMVTGKRVPPPPVLPV